MNVPALRFPEFKGNWEKKKLGEVMIEGKLGGNYENSESNLGIPIIKMGNINRGIISLDKIQYLPIQENFNEDNILKDGDLLFNTRNTLELVGKVAIWRNELPFALYNSNLMRITFNQLFEKTNRFMNSYFNTKKSTSQLYSFATGTTSVAAIYGRDLVNFEISFPTLPEQTKIANFLTAIDGKIQSLKKKKDLLEQYKKGIMQKLFSQELRFKTSDGNDFPDWEVKKLGEVGKTYGGLSGKSKEDFGIGKPYIQYKQIFDDSKIDISRFELVDIKENENQNKVNFGDVFFTVSSETPNEIGMSSVLLDEVAELYLNSFCFGFRANSLNDLSPYFSQYLFRSENFRNEIIKLAQGSTRYNMSKIQLMKIEIGLPCLKEQTLIANFLSAIDDKINHTQTEILKTEHWKKGLLQKMFV